MSEQLPERPPVSSLAPSGGTGSSKGDVSYERECMFCGGPALVHGPAGWDALDVDAAFSGEARQFADMPDGDPIGVGCVRCAVAERSDGPDVSPPSAGSGLEESVYREIAEAMLTEGIERWNADPLGDESAHEWLGLTWDQYRTLIEVVGPREAL